MTPTLRQLSYFAALAETGHFGRAAERCRVTQPALSMQVRELEATLGVPLVERTASGLRLTGAGEEVAERGREILLAVQDLAELARRRAGVLSGVLRLGVIPSIGPYLLPRVLPELHGGYPDLELSLRESQTQYLLDDLVAGRLDLLILALPVDRPEIETLRLFEDVFTLAVHPEHPLAARDCVRQADVACERLLLLEEGHCLRDQALALCSAAGARRMEEFRASSLATVVQMVINGFGCTILPELALPVEIGARAGIRVVRFADPPPARTIGLAWRASSPRRRDFAAFAKLLIEAVFPQPSEAASGWKISGLVSPRASS